MRNRTRRRLRAVVTGMSDDLTPGGIYLLGADHGAVELPFAELKTAVRELVRQTRESRR